MKRTIISRETIDDGSEMIQQLKEKFQSTPQRSEQLQILTVLPKSWSLKKIQQEFGVSTENHRCPNEFGCSYMCIPFVHGGPARNA